MVNWINGFNAGNKKEKYSLTFRLGTFTVLEIKWCPCTDKDCTRFRSKHSGVDYVPTVLLLDKGNGVGNVLAPDRDFDELEECLQLIQTHLQE